jgi:hypothetical protein
MNSTASCIKQLERGMSAELFSKLYRPFHNLMHVCKQSPVDTAYMYELLLNNNY